MYLRFYHPYKTNKINRLIHASASKMALKTSSVVEQPMHVLKMFRVTHSFLIRSIKTLRIIYPKHPPFGYDRKNHIRCGFFGSIIRFKILVKKRTLNVFCTLFQFSSNKYIFFHFEQTSMSVAGTTITVIRPPAALIIGDHSTALVTKATLGTAFIVSRLQVIPVKVN